MGPQSHVRSLTHSHFAYTICKISLLTFFANFVRRVASFGCLVGWLDGSLCSCLSPQCQHVDMWDVTSDSEVAWWELFSVLLHKIGTVTGGLHEFPIDSGFFNIKRQYQHYCKVIKKLWFQPELAIHRERERERVVRCTPLLSKRGNREVHRSEFLPIFSIVLNQRLLWYYWFCYSGTSDSVQAVVRHVVGPD